MTRDDKSPQSPPDLDALEARHIAEERAEAGRALTDAPRPFKMIRPAGGELSTSSRWLERLYQGDRVVREKKPGVFDHLRSAGPWFVSVDDPPLSVLDGMTQTATTCGGFAEDAVVCAYVEGRFADTIMSAEDTSLGGVPAADHLAAKLTELVPGLPQVTFLNSGAESCEKAFALCRLQARSAEQRKLLAFEGSFHGRTLLSLHASHNPKKRAPFEFAGHEVTFSPFPVWGEPNGPEPEVPTGFLEAIADGKLDELSARHSNSADGLLAEEVMVLANVHGHLARREYFAVAIEPMQSEGGDRYGSARFYRALRLLTRHHGVPLIFDEVQTGFGLGGTFAWHPRFGLVDREGKPDYPDCVTFAKRAQVGVVMSAFADPEPTSSHAASMVRGLVHAEMMADESRGAEVEAQVRPLLVQVAERFPSLVSSPRNRGYALAFDLPDTDHLMAYLGQRFWRGAIVFGAGSRTVRYRLNTTFGEAEVEALFETVEASLTWLMDHPGEKPPKWEDVAGVRPPQTEPPPEIRVRQVDQSSEASTLEEIVALEARVYEPARRDKRETLALGFEDPEGVAVIAEVNEGGRWKLIGSALAAPLEDRTHTPGPRADPMYGRNNTLYSIAVTVDPAYHGHGLGHRLKAAQIECARAMRGEDGGPRYLHVAGRNRVGHTGAMQHINRAYGAYEVLRLDNAYEGEGVASYYRLPVGAYLVDPVERPGSDVAAPDVDRAPDMDPAPDMDFASGVSRPFREAPATLLSELENGSLYGPTVNKITVMNYVTPAIVRALEWVDAVVPDLPHLYLTSSRDECFDKSVRLLRCHRRSGQVVLGFDGGYVGHTTAAARSLSDPGVHRQGPAHFDGFRRVPHPAQGSVDVTIDALRAAVVEAGGAERVIGLFFEPVQERTGLVVPDTFWPALDALRAELGIPVVLVETATASYRSGGGAFATSHTNFVPDVLTWWGGAQVGFVHCSSAQFVPTPLTLVSTWDGDELSLIRVHHQLRAARNLDVSTAAAKLDEALSPCRDAGLAVRGAGLYRVVDAGEQTESMAVALLAQGVRVRPFPNGCFAVAAPVDVADEALVALRGALEGVLS